MRDRSKQLLVINTGKKESEQTRLPAQSGTTHIIGGGGLSVNMSDYLLKSIWDKVFEIRTDGQGTEYIFGKLPMVTQYGITMYSGDGVDIPSLASGLPFDGRTIWYNPDTQQIEVIGGTGGGSGEGVSNFWDLSGIPSWITNSKPKYTYSEIEGTPDLTKYALVSQIPSLSGYATESWVLQKNYATKATTLRGYGITDAYTKTNVDDLLKSYVTLGGTQTITGEKNFTGGLKVNGSPIYYDTEKKYWKLEGDLLVTGGVTMYGSDSSFTPSTIMDAILYDDATLGINSNGQLYVKGGAGGGINTTDLQNYLTQNSYLNVTSGDGRYLKLSGGTIGGNIVFQGGYLRFTNSSGSFLGAYNVNDSGEPLCLKGSTWNTILHSGNYSQYALPLSGGTINGDLFVANSYGGIVFTNTSNSSSAFLFYNGNADWYLTNKDWGAGYKIWHEGSDGSGSGLDADLLDGKHLSDILSSNVASATILAPYKNDNAEFNLIFGTRSDNTQGRRIYDDGWNIMVEQPGGKGVIARENGNVASAIKLQTAKTIWGQSFDGTGNVSGSIRLDDGELLMTSSNHWGASAWRLFSYGPTLQLLYGSEYSTASNTSAKFNNDGSINVNSLITYEGVNSRYSKFDANGLACYTTSTGGYAVGVGLYAYDGSFYYPMINAYGTGSSLSYIFIGGAYNSPWFKIDTSANMLVQGGITMYSDQRKKTILNHVELSLKQIANAPIIEHYYNSDEKRTTHVGSIAQYWASMNDWFCKLDSEGFYTMEIQNAALASAISIARELDRYETKTDKDIKKLKKRICELEEEIERLKAS